MLSQEPRSDAIPWTVRDVWWGVGILVVWLAVFVALSVLVKFVELDINPGLFIGLAELVLLVPAWWFAMRKYGVGWDALGMRGFQTSALAIGCGLMIFSYLFNLAYGTFLAM